MTHTPDDLTGGTPEYGAPSALTLPGARFDPITGAELTGRPGFGGAGRRQTYALQQGEPVMSFNLVTSLLPLASGSAPQTYRWALALGLVIPVIAGALGFLAFAFVAAALVVPVVYVVYLYDVNQWDDEPLGVVGLAIGVAAVLGAAFTFLWHSLVADDTAAVSGSDIGASGVRWTSLLVLCLVVPVVSELLKQLGPVLLARRPAFDDLIDALTFGVAAGSAYAAAESIVVNRHLLGSFGHLENADSAFWVSLVLSIGIVKPVVYGAATGIAVAAFSGVGRGYRGFGPSYARGLAEAIGANVVFQLAMYAAGRIGGVTGAVTGLVLGGLVAVVLILRLRHLLHVAVLEAALEVGSASKDAARGDAWCPSCDLPLLDGANFCVACGTSVRAGAKTVRRRNADPVATAAHAGPAPGAALAPRPDQQPTLKVVSLALAVIVAGGAIAQIVSAAAGEPSAPAAPSLSISPSTKGGGIEPAPSPAPLPGPSVEPSESPSSSGLLGSDGTRLLAAGAPRLADDSGGVPFRFARGWKILFESDVRIVASNGAGVITLDLTQPPAEPGAMLQNHLQSLLKGGLQGLQITKPTPMPLPNGNFVSAERISFKGVVAGQQGGAQPLEGFAFYLVRTDGLGITYSGLHPEGALTEGSQLLKDYAFTLNSIIGG